MPLYPGFIVAADIGLAGVLLLTAPVLGVLMGVTAASVLAVVVLKACGHLSLGPRSEASYHG
jgi:hypothetical protein